MTARESREAWIAWAEKYPKGDLYDSIIASCQGAESRCQYCEEPIRFDIVEGGGVPDWGAPISSHIPGLDYGCDMSPDNSDEGTGGHLPVGVARPVRAEGRAEA